MFPSLAFSAPATVTTRRNAPPRPSKSLRRPPASTTPATTGPPRHASTRALVASAATTTTTTAPVEPAAAAAQSPPHAPGALEQYRRALAETRDSGRVRVVMFHASYCRSCKAAKGKFVQMMERGGEYAGRADYTLVDVGGDEQVTEILGIHNLPSFHLYVAKGDQVGLLDELSCGGFGCTDRIRRRLDRFAGDDFNVDDYEF